MNSHVLVPEQPKYPQPYQDRPWHKCVWVGPRVWCRKHQKPLESRWGLTWNSSSTINLAVLKFSTTAPLWSLRLVPFNDNQQQELSKEPSNRQNNRNGPMASNFGNQPYGTTNSSSSNSYWFECKTTRPSFCFRVHDARDGYD